MPETKEIFRYTLPDGKEAAADPMRIRRSLSRLLGGQTAKVAADFNGPDHVAAEMAYEKLRTAVCAAFNLGQPFDEATGQGITESAWLKIYNDFMGFMEGEKKPLA
jgi:hypothetical protein